MNGQPEQQEPQRPALDKSTIIELLNPAVKAPEVPKEAPAVQSPSTENATQANGEKKQDAAQEKKSRKDRAKFFSQLFRITTNSNTTDDIKTEAYWENNWKEYFSVEPMDGEVGLHKFDLYVLVRFQSQTTPKVFYDKMKQFGTVLRYEIVRSKSATIESILKKAKERTNLKPF